MRYSRYLVVWYDNHDYGRFHVNDLIQLLDVGGWPVVVQHEHFRRTHRHAQRGSNFLQRVHKLFGDCLIP